MGDQKMKGYSDINECIEEYKVLIAAKIIDFGRSEGDSVTRYLIKRLESRLKNASRRFDAQMEKNGFDTYDLNLIAFNSMIPRVRSVDEFCNQMVDKYSPEERIRRILKSAAFRKGKITLLNSILPKKISTKEELIDFIKLNERMSHSLLRSVCNFYAKKNWRAWLEEAIEKRKVQRIHGEWW